MKKKLKKISSPSGIYSSRKELLKAAKKRKRRKSLYPFGFEYARERR